MLYDPKWKQRSETKVDPFSIDALIAWLEKQPADLGYRYDCSGYCLLAQYFTSLGYRKVTVGPFEWRAKRTKRRELPPMWNEIALSWPETFQNNEMTFGGALDRAREVRAGACRGRGRSSVY